MRSAIQEIVLKHRHRYGYRRPWCKVPVRRALPYTGFQTLEGKRAPKDKGFERLTCGRGIVAAARLYSFVLADVN